MNIGRFPARSEVRLTETAQGKELSLPVTSVSIHLVTSLSFTPLVCSGCQPTIFSVGILSDVHCYPTQTFWLCLRVMQTSVKSLWALLLNIKGAVKISTYIPISLFFPSPSMALRNGSPTTTHRAGKTKRHQFFSHELDRDLKLTLQLEGG